MPDWEIAQDRECWARDWSAFQRGLTASGFHRYPEGFVIPDPSGEANIGLEFSEPFLYPRLEAIGQSKAGAHAFRRFRNTYLRNKTACPDGLVKFWMGHSGRDMSDLYDKVRDDIGYRKDVAESVGIGFELKKKAEVVPCVPWIESKNAVEVFA
jgi:hypothetical protein